MLAYLLGVSFRWEEPNYSGDCRLDLHQEQVNTIENGKQIPTQWGFLLVGRISLYETVEAGTGYTQTLRSGISPANSPGRL